MATYEVELKNQRRSIKFERSVKKFIHVRAHVKQDSFCCNYILFRHIHVNILMFNYKLFYILFLYTCQHLFFKMCKKMRAFLTLTLTILKGRIMYEKTINTF